MKKLGVRFTRRPGEERVVGQLAETQRRVFFEYDRAFLSDPLWLSPFKLPPQPGLFEHLQLAEPAGLSNREARSVLEEVTGAVSRWRAYAREAGLGGKTTRAIETAITGCLARL